MPLDSGQTGNPLRRARHAVILGSIGLLLSAMFALGACTDPTDQRAIQPGQVAASLAPAQSPDSTTTQETVISSVTSSLSVTPTIVSGVPSPFTRLVYFTRGGDIWQIPVDGGDPTPVVTGHSILAFAPSPDGQQVAVIYVASDSDQEHLADYQADGTSIVDVPLSVPADDKRSSGGEIQSIAWSPTGDQFAIARQDGSISVITQSGTVTQIVAPDSRHFPGSLSISPNGQSLLYLDPDLPGRSTSLYTIPLRGGASRRLVDGTQPSHPVLAATWLPNNGRIAYLQAVASSPEGTGDVFTVDAGTVKSDLAVPSAQFAPVAGIGEFAFSGDGRWIAFTLYVPNDTGSRFQGLWLMNVETSATRQVSVEAGRAVSDLWWGQGTLLYRTIEAGNASSPERYSGIESFSLYSMKPDGERPVLRLHVS